MMERLSEFYDRFGDIALIVLVFGIVIGAGVYFGAFG